IQAFRVFVGVSRDLTTRSWSTRNPLSRNLIIFQGVTWSTEEIIKKSFSWAKQCVSIRKGNSVARQAKRGEPDWGGNWVRLQTDGMVKIESEHAAAGRVLRSERKEWILGFNKRLGKCSIFYAKLCDISIGLSILHGEQCDRVLLQTDNLEVFEAIHVSNLKSSKSVLIRRISQLLAIVKN
ncbi:hypothetical protein Gotri_011257, partial [Gossypium trilobum]|nr:hypothetical protein [Gossypium trilobum]